MAIEVRATDFGRALLVKALNNTCPILFTHMKFGNGANPEDYASLIDLVNPLITSSITRIDHGVNFVQVTAAFSNNDVATDFSLTEVGLFAMDQDGVEITPVASGSGISEATIVNSTFIGAVTMVPGVYEFSYSSGSWHYGTAEVNLEDYGISVDGTPSNGDEVTVTFTVGASNLGTHLFAYVNQGDDPEPIYGRDSNKLKENSFSVVVIVDDSDNVTAIVRSLSYVTLDRFEAHVLDMSNPHNVTAAQLGLDNVPNVSTNDQTPTFTRSSSLSDLGSGETMSTLFGKLSRAVNDLISHIGNRNNPHNVTISQIGAAAASHSHDASAINSGTLAVARGGTGKASWTANGIVYANATNSLSQLAPTSANSVIVVGPSGAPTFTTIANIQNISIYHVGTSAPSNTKLLWIDTTANTGGLKYHNGSSWVHVPTAYSG